MNLSEKKVLLETKLISSLGKVFPDEVVGKPLKEVSILQNEAVSFQIAYKSTDTVFPMYVVVETDIRSEYIEEYKVAYVPVENAATKNSDDLFDRKTVGMYPDILLERNVVSDIKNVGFWDNIYTEIGQKNIVNAVPGCYNSIWFEINPKDGILESGKHIVTIKFYNSYSNETVAQESININVIPQKLVSQDFIYTSWFHADCLADLYGVDVFSDRHFQIMQSFISEARKHGMNMCLLPAFTPPLDTPVDMERRTVQLVGVKKQNGEYTFDFSLLVRYINMCLECGMDYFEHCQLFTQWGAKHAPKIVAEVDGIEQKIFGWQTDIFDGEYERFLDAYFCKLNPLLEDLGLSDKVLFHIADEPHELDTDYYKKASEIINRNVKGNMIGDALSAYKFYEDGLVKLPIVSITSKDMKKFTENCDYFWIYYCGETMKDGLSNRMISNSSARNRILGIQAYVAGAKGFLHWGYNYYYDTLSQGLFDPKITPCGYCGFTSLPGAGFVVYPGYDGSAIPSIRMKVFHDAINDYRALMTLEKEIGRNEVFKIINKHFGDMDFHTKASEQEILLFREEINSRM